MSHELIIASAAYILIDRLLCNDKRPRRLWRHALYKERRGSSLLSDLKFQPIGGQYKIFPWINPTDFQYLLNLIGPKVQRKNTTLREAISVQDRLAVTLKYLATGDSFTSLQYLFRISKQAISCIIPEVCQAITDALKQHVKMPKNREEWVKTSDQFMRLWNFPHAIGAMGGKRILIQCPFNGGTDLLNYKSHSSIALLAVVDADYKFLYAHVGGQGRTSDSDVLKGCSLNEMIEKKTLKIPDSKVLQDRNKPIPYFFLCDLDFPTGENVMKPYSGIHPEGSKERAFNYREARARGVVENAFGVLASVFRVLRQPMLLQAEKAEVIVMAAIHLHNFLRCGFSHSFYTPHGAIDTENNMTGEVTLGNWRNDREVKSFFTLSASPRRSADMFKENREELADYFMNEGKLPWQNHYA